MSFDLHAALGLEKPSQSFPVEIPEALRHLPVAKQIGSIDFEAARFICRASTGGGKSLLLAPAEISQRKARGENAVVVMRQPSKLAVAYIRSGLRQFWPGLKVGICTRDDKEGIEGADIIVISDGSLVGCLERLKGRKAIYYIDEAHAMTGEATEIEWGIAKKLNLEMRFLSATVDAQPLVEYLGGDVPVYDLEGRTFPIQKSIEIAPMSVFSREDHSELFERVSNHIADAKFEDDGILIFVPTRRMAETLAAKFRDDLPTKFAHGGVNPLEIEQWTKAHEGEAFAVFATTAAAMGITIGNVGRVVACDQVVDSEVVMGIERQFSKPMPDNLLLQAIGRTGRVKPGKATLLVPSKSAFELDSDRDWADVKPRPIEGACSKKTPFNVVLALAQHGIKRNEDIDLYSKLDPRELAHARSELVRMGCIELDGSLTRMGRLIGATPLEPHLAHLVHSAPNRDAKIATLAAVVMGEKGTYNLVNVKPRSRELAQQAPGFKMLPGDCLHVGSGPMTMAHILARYAALPYGQRAMWCSMNNLNERQMAFAFYDFKNACKPLLREDETPEELLDSVDWRDHDVDLAVDEHIASHRSLRGTRLDGNWGRIAIDNQYYSCSVDSVLMFAWGKHTGHYGWVSGKPRIIVPQSGGRPFVSLEMCILQESDAE